MIRLDKEWVIDADPATGYTLARQVEVKRVDKDTKAETTATELRDQTYHRTIGQAATAYLRRKQRQAIQSRDYTPSEAVRALQNVAEEVSNLFKEVLDDVR